MKKIAKNEFDMGKILESLSYNVRVNRLKKLYDIDEILEVLGYGDGSMDEDEVKKINSLEEKSPAWYQEIYRLAVDNGNFTQAIAMNKYLPV